MSFHRIIAQMSEGTVTFPEDWTQGRATFGGAVTAAAVRAMRDHVPAERRPRSVMTSFVGPLPPGPARVRTRVLRAGSSSTHLQAELTHDGGVGAVVLACFGDARPSAVTVPPRPRPEAVEPEEALEMPYLPGVTPTFTQHFAYRWTRGGMPFSGAEAAGLGGWCRFRAPFGPADEEAILALVDAWPGAILPLMKAPAPASSVTWSIDFLPLSGDHDTGDWWLFDSDASAASGGFAQTHATLWAPNGELAAVSRQLVAVFG